jgi:anti-sigma factor ChrR (cupin superfamily)
MNDDFSKRAVVHADKQHWVASPQPGVERVLLDRVGAESARATSLVRYAPNSHFAAHEHPGGEEILVLDGVLCDERGEFPKGAYLRNPPGTRHTPSSVTGALLFVKLRQMRADDTRSVHVDIFHAENWIRRGEREQALLLSTDPTDWVEIVRLAPHAALRPVLFEGGVEYLVLEGMIADESTSYSRGSWLRLPPGTFQHVRSGADGALFYRKTGHLAQVLGCEGVTA